MFVSRTTSWRQFKYDCHRTSSVIPLALATEDEVIKFWKVKVKGQGRWGYVHYWAFLVQPWSENSFLAIIGTLKTIGRIKGGRHLTPAVSPPTAPVCDYYMSAENKTTSLKQQRNNLNADFKPPLHCGHVVSHGLPSFARWQHHIESTGTLAARCTLCGCIF